MYILNGIVYGEEVMNVFRVIAVKPLKDRIMLPTFSNGETRLFDATILEGEVFEPLKNENIFRNPSIEHGVVTWLDGDIDCVPEYMYKNSYVYTSMMA